MHLLLVFFLLSPISVCIVWGADQQRDLASSSSTSGADQAPAEPPSRDARQVAAKLRSRFVIEDQLVELSDERHVETRAEASILLSGLLISNASPSRCAALGQLFRWLQVYHNELEPRAKTFKRLTSFSLINLAVDAFYRMDFYLALLRHDMDWLAGEFMATVRELERYEANLSLDTVHSVMACLYEYAGWIRSERVRVELDTFLSESVMRQKVMAWLVKARGKLDYQLSPVERMYLNPYFNMESLNIQQVRGVVEAMDGPQSSRLRLEGFPVNSGDELGANWWSKLAPLLNRQDDLSPEEALAKVLQPVRLFKPKTIPIQNYESILFGHATDPGSYRQLARQPHVTTLRPEILRVATDYLSVRLNLLDNLQALGRFEGNKWPRISMELVMEFMENAEIVKIASLNGVWLKRHHIRVAQVAFRYNLIVDTLAEVVESAEQGRLELASQQLDKVAHLLLNFDRMFDVDKLWALHKTLANDLAGIRTEPSQPTSLDRCTICQDDMETFFPDSRGHFVDHLQLNCGHMYHSICIGQWMAVSNRKDCPICRNDWADPTDFEHSSRDDSADELGWW